MGLKVIMTKRAQRERVLVIEYIQQNFGIKAANRADASYES